MERLFLVREDGDGAPLRDALILALGHEVQFLTPDQPLTTPPARGERRVVLPLYPQSNDTSRSLSRLVPHATHLVWFSYLDAYIEAVAHGLAGHVIFCAEDVTDEHEIYRRDVRQSAHKIAARAGTTHELYFGISPPEGQRVSLTAPIVCTATRAWEVTPTWGTHPAFVAALAALVRKALRDDD
jgi:hypothetical protein